VTVGGRVVRKALVLAYGVHESGYREVIALDVGEAETEGVLAQLPALAGEAWSQRCAARCLGRACGTQESDRPGARLPLAALQRPLPARGARPCSPRAAANARRAAAADLHCRVRRAGARARRRRARSDCASRRRRSRRCWRRRRRTCLPSTALPAEHWSKLRSTNPLERVNREIGRRTDVVGIFPNDRALLRLAASVVIEQDDEWPVGRRCLSLDSLAPLLEQRREHEDNGTRRCSHSPRPEPPTTPTSYATSWDLTPVPQRIARDLSTRARLLPRLTVDELRPGAGASASSRRGSCRVTAAVWSCASGPAPHSSPTTGRATRSRASRSS
jgi:Transposase, Mutator family